VPSEIAADWADRWAKALDSFLAVRDRSSDEQFFDVAYEEVENAPEATIERIYDFLGWPLDDQALSAMRAFLAANPKNKHGVHRYSLSQYGLDRDTERARFRRYCERFAIPMQADHA
jgi:hypothetical protein